MSETKLTGTVNKVDKSIDRSKTCPLLLRMFYNKNRHHSARDYEQGQMPENELQIHTWMDATLNELTQYIKEVNPDARRRGTQFSFSIVTSDDSYNHYRLIDIGKIENGQRRSDDQIQLGNKRFHIGDFLDVAITQKKPEQLTQNKRRGGNERNNVGPVRSAQRNDHRDRPY